MAKVFGMKSKNFIFLHKKGILFLFLSWIRDLPRRPDAERLMPFGESLGFTPRLLNLSKSESRVNLFALPNRRKEREAKV